MGSQSALITGISVRPVALEWTARECLGKSVVGLPMMTAATSLHRGAATFAFGLSMVVVKY